MCEDERRKKKIKKEEEVIKKYLHAISSLAFILTPVLLIQALATRSDFALTLSNETAVFYAVAKYEISVLLRYRVVSMPIYEYAYAYLGLAPCCVCMTDRQTNVFRCIS